MKKVFQKVVKFILAAALFLVLSQESTWASGEEIIFSQDNQTNLVPVNSTAAWEEFDGSALFKTDFESDTPGGRPTSIGSTGTAADTTVCAAGSNNNTTQHVNFNKRLRAEFPNNAKNSGVLYIDFDAMVTDGHLSVGLLYSDSMTTYGKWIFGMPAANGTEFFTWQTLNGVPPTHPTDTFKKKGTTGPIPFSANVWHSYRLKVDIDNSSVTLFVDGVESETITGYEYFGPSTSIGGVVFRDENSINEAYIDNIKIYTGEVEAYKAYPVNLGTSLSFNINDDIIFQNPGFNNVEIDISYYDTGCGYFSLKYDSESHQEKTYDDYVELYNTNKIVKKTIRLEDAYFGNRCAKGTSDLIINVPNTASGKTLYIISVQVRVLPSKSCIKIDAQSDAYGNIFFDDDNRTFSAEYFNKSSETIDFNARYEIKNTDKTVTYHSETKSFTVNATSSVTDSYPLSSVNDYGTYLLCITASDENGLYESVLEIPFSFCVGGENGGINNRIGINGHFNKGKESENGMEILRKAGFANIREGYYWEEFEAEKGVYKETANATECYTNAELNQMDILVLAAFSNTNYSETERHIPATDEEREAFANYVYEMLKARDGKVNVVEVWNEPNLEKFNANNLGQEDYVRLLKAVYEKVKPDYPHVKIGAPAISNVQYIDSWLPDMLASDIDGDGSYDAYKYFDVLTMHHYWRHKLPEVVGGINAIFNYMEQYGCEDKEIYHTEFGAQETVSQYNATTGKGTMVKLGEEKQARLLSQYYLLLQGNNLGQRFYIYNFSDNGLAENVQHNSLGIVKPDNFRVPYAAKPALLAMANINSLLKNTDSAEVVQSGNVNVIKYSGTNFDEEVYALFTFNGEDTYTFTPVCDDVEFIDMYGNRLDIPWENGGYTLNISERPVYARCVIDGTV